MHHQLDNSKARLPPNTISHPLHVTPHLSTDPMPPASLPLETSQQPSTTIHIIATSGRAGMSEWLFLWFKLIQYLFYCWIFFGALCTIIQPLWCTFVMSLLLRQWSKTIFKLCFKFYEHPCKGYALHWCMDVDFVVLMLILLWQSIAILDQCWKWQPYKLILDAAVELFCHPLKWQW